jgi:hypothetical protein
MRIVEDRDGVRIEGEGSERAQIGYATAVDGRLSVTVGKAIAHAAVLKTPVRQW